MPRLVTFGCSFTYGQSLPDCHEDISRPSNFAWPKLLSDKLNYECVNLSSPGSGNFQILMNVLKTDFKTDDLVILAFSYFHRYDFYQMTDKIGEGTSINFKQAKHKQIIMSEMWALDNYQEKNYWDNWLAIQHCELFLNFKKVKNYSFLNLPYGAKENKPNLLELSGFMDDVRCVGVDVALDNQHPGIRSHKILAEKLWNKLGKNTIEKV